MESETGTKAPLERHPWPPFAPEGARVLLAGTFPPDSRRWSMDFYYPNRNNDFWRIIGLLFFDDATALMTADHKAFDLPRIREFLTDKGIALSDTGLEVRRLAGNASDKFLDIVTPRDISALLESLPDCVAVGATGEKAASVIARQLSTPLPAMGKAVEGTLPDGRTVSFMRVPSTSRAYPMKLEQKATFYRSLFKTAGIL